VPKKKNHDLGSKANEGEGAEGSRGSDDELLADFEVRAPLVDLRVLGEKSREADAVCLGDLGAGVTPLDGDGLRLATLASTSAGGTRRAGSGTSGGTSTSAGTIGSASSDAHGAVGGSSDGVVGVDGEVRAVVERAVLGDGAESGLMVRRRVDGAHAVATGEETGRNGGIENAVDGDLVEALEEGELVRVGRGGLIQGGESLNHDVRVTIDETIIIQVLGRGVVLLLGVDEVAGSEIVDGHQDRESLVLGERRVAIRGEDELGRRHGGSARDHAHGDGVAASIDELLTVREGDVDRQAEINEVVTGHDGRNLAGFYDILAIVETMGLDDCGVQSEGCLGIITLHLGQAGARGAKDGGNDSNKCEDGKSF